MRGEFEADVRKLIKANIELVYYMRGSIQYDDMYNRTVAERQLMHEFIQERFQSQEKALFVTTI